MLQVTGRQLAFPSDHSIWIYYNPYLSYSYHRPCTFGDYLSGFIWVKILEKVSLELIIWQKYQISKQVNYFDNGSSSGDEYPWSKYEDHEEDPWSKYIAIVLIFDIFGHTMSSRLTLSNILTLSIFIQVLQHIKLIIVRYFNFAVHKSLYHRTNPICCHKPFFSNADAEVVM